MRLIDADYLKNMGYELHRTFQKDANTLIYEVKKIADVPTIEAEPVRRGRWLVTPYTECDNTYKCSVCGMEWAFLEGEPKDSGANYCPNCGARMEGEE